MSNEIHHTKGIVLWSVNISEANKLFFVLTENYGFIKVVAQGIRKSESKLRALMQDYSFVNMSLTNGKAWRLTNVFDGFSFVSGREEKEKFSKIIQISGLLKTLLHGEEENKGLFSMVLSSFNFIKNNSLDKEELELVEIVSIMNILSNLGYLDSEVKELRKEDLQGLKIHKKEFIRGINKAIKETQL